MELASRLLMAATPPQLVERLRRWRPGGTTGVPAAGNAFLTTRQVPGARLQSWQIVTQITSHTRDGRPGPV